MRTHWGYAHIRCQHCKEEATVLLIGAHQREGIGCQHCFRKAVPAGEVQELMAQIEQREARAAAQGGGDAAA